MRLTCGLTCEIIKLTVVIAFATLVLCLVFGCAAQNPFEEGSEAWDDRHAYIMHKRGVDIMNYENCIRVAPFMIHMDHKHDNHTKITPAIIKMDLAYNGCFRALGIFWIPYMDEYLIEADQ